MNKNNPLPLPSIKELGQDLLSLTKLQISWTLIKPFLFFTLYFVFAYYNFWVLAIISVVAILFITYVSTSHDLVHKTLGLSKNKNTTFLVLIEMLVLRSGHSFKMCHLNHHKYFPDKLDIEGSSVYMPLWRVLLEGPIYQSKLFLWAYKNGKKQDKFWLIAEGFFIVSIIALSILLYPISPILFYYVLLVSIGSWVYPFFTVYLHHIAEEESPLFQTKAYRGKIISFILAQHNYHLEHHLYPMVPHQNWHKLAKRLDPYLINAGVKPITL